jgi:hypothetical protein
LVAVGGTGVEVSVAVGGTDVDVSVAVGGTGVGVEVGVGVKVSVGVAVSVAVGGSAVGEPAGERGVGVQVGVGVKVGAGGVADAPTDVGETGVGVAIGAQAAANSVRAAARMSIRYRPRGLILILPPMVVESLANDRVALDGRRRGTAPEHSSLRAAQGPMA